MFHYVLLLVGLSAAFASPVLLDERAIGGRIVGGRNATIEEVPYLVSVRLIGRYLCGGSIINEFWIVTAAYCAIRTADLYTIHAGSSLIDAGGSVHAVETVHRHPSFRFPADFSNDIALMKVVEKFQFSERIQPVPLPAHLEKIHIGTPNAIAGFGMLQWLNGTNSRFLQIGEVRTISRIQCQFSLLFEGRVTDEMICAASYPIVGDVDFCNGDAGGPLFGNEKLRGIMSWGRHCGSSGSPSVYVNVAVFVNWIRDITSV